MKGKKEEDIKGTALECGTFGAFHEGKGGKHRLLQIAPKSRVVNFFFDKFVSFSSMITLPISTF
jgi:hypothetical protein